MADFVLSFDPGGSIKSWAYALSSVKHDAEERYSFHIVETGFVPVVEEIARPNFETLTLFFDGLRDRHWLHPRLGGHTCDLVAERYVGRGHTGSLNESIPFHLGYWSCVWPQELGRVRLIMASQWKVKAKKWNSFHTFTPNSPFENWWEDYYAYLLPATKRKRSKSERHIQDACAIGWYYWRFEQGLNCLPEGVKELIC